jgi:peptidoglycan/xylan/chitin deacetylase (PgdA/CDA1 family)
VTVTFADPRDRVLYSPISQRPPVTWPGDARVALWVAPNIEHYEYTPPPNPYFSIFTRVPHPDVQQYAFRDYGNRVGLWRLAEVLDEYDVTATVSLNLAVLDHYPDIREAIIERDWAIMSHGIYNTRPMFGWSEEEERAFLADNIETVRRHTGRQLKGLFGPASSVTDRTPDLMAEAGLLYHADWRTDEQPVPIMVAGDRRLVSVPYGLELNDGNPVPMSVETLSRSWQANFDRLWRDGETSGRVMCLAIHPYVIGQPHAIDRLKQTLDHIKSHDGVWYTTADAIAEHYLEHHYEAFLEHARSLPDNQGGHD